MIFSAKDTARIALDNSKLDGMTDPPEEMGELERVLYWQLLFLCKRYRSGKIDAECAKKLKSKYITEYEQEALLRKTYANIANGIPPKEAISAMINGKTVAHTHMGISASYTVHGVITRYSEEKGWTYSLELQDKSGCIVYAALEDTEVQDQ